MIDAKHIRKVTLHKGPNGVEVYLLHENQVDKFIEAQEKLHHKPGYNPHNGNDTSPLTYLEVQKLNPDHDKQLWWTTPSLKNDGTGATLLGWETTLQKSYPIDTTGVLDPIPHTV